MISQRVASSGSLVATGSRAATSADGGGLLGALFLYNKRTGKVYRVYTDCGASEADGCLVPLPVIDEGVNPNVVPRPQVRNGGSRLLGR